MSRALLVEAVAPGTTVQDLGRPGLAHLGVTTSGAADRAALRLANRLVGNPQTAAGLEVTLGGLAVRASATCTVAVTGARCPVAVDGVPQPRNAVLFLPTGSRLALGPAVAGVRAYLAVRGGIDVPRVLGSRSRDTLAGLGPPPPAAGDELPIGTELAGWPVVEVAAVPEPGPGPVVLRAIPGPWPDALGSGALAALAESDWRVAADSDRVGLRLEGASVLLRPRYGGDGPPAVAGWPSAGLVRGAVQVPPGGEPVLFLPDHPVTGGYPVLACLLDADTDRAAQVRPGQGVRLRLEAKAEWH
jgi:biotin-dependent carboxylase-like uncharacterized protein